ncbi:MAG: Rpn family recombination-promoting nuclease/putative transposase [Arcicella sp.]|jgi:hypothetical protein|nr:Rpn family recombination-promoting nuclease/putative transposase [Arcicella sp.]
MKRDDALWKGILEDLFDDFLLFYFPESVNNIDFTKKFVFLDKELEQLFPNTQDEFNPKYVDKLVKVSTKSGKEEWILIHIEVQGSSDKVFTQRMYTYHYRIFDKYKKPITSLAILTDRNKSFKPSVYTYEFMGTSLRYEFNVYKVMDTDNQTLKISDNPFAVVVRVVKTALERHKISEEELFDLKIDLARELLRKNFSKQKIRNLLQFLKLYIRFDNKELINKFETEIAQLKNRQITMGLEEFVLDRAKRMGLQEGIEQGKQLTGYEKDFAFVKNLLLQTDFSIEKIASLVGTDIDFVMKVKELV